MPSIPDYPTAAQPLDGTELVPLWQNGKQVSAQAKKLTDSVSGAIIGEIQQAQIDVAAGVAAVAGSVSATAADRAQTGLDAASTAADRLQVHADRVASDASVTSVINASAAAGAYANAYATALPRGVTGTTALVGGSGGTNGTFALGFAGGSITGMTGTFTVAGGAVTAITITNAGLGTGTTPPTLSFAGSAGLTGASATAVVGPIVAQTKTYWAATSDGLSLALFSNDGTSTPAIVLGPDGLQIKLPIKPTTYTAAGPQRFSLTDTNGYRFLDVTLTDFKHPAVDSIRTRITNVEAYAAKQPLFAPQGPAAWALTDANGYNFFRVTPTTLQHVVIDNHTRQINAAARGTPDPTIADMRNLAERIGLHMSGESVSLGHGAAPLYSTAPSPYSDMFGNAGLTLASIVPDDISDIANGTDPHLLTNRAALTAAFETSYGVDADDWTSHGESPMSGCAQMIVQLLKDEDGRDFAGEGMRFLLADDGRNGSPISTEDETGTGYTAQRVYASMSQAQALYQAGGKSYAPAAQMLIIGTNDNASDAINYPTGNEKFFYNKALLVQQQRQAKARQIVGGNFRLPLLLGQTATHTNPAYLAPIPHVALDQLQLALDHPEFLLACIQYACEQGSAGNVHFSGAGSKQAGAYFGLHLKRLLFDGIRLAPLVPVFHAYGSKIVATFPIRPGHKVAGGLTISDTTVLSNWGVTAVDASGAAKVLSNPRVVGRDRVVWDAPETPANTWKFRSGYVGNATKGWTNIGETRSDATLIFDPGWLRLPMYRWLPICEVPLS